MRADLAAALMLLTRVPAGWLAGSGALRPRRAVWAYPLVGALLGGCGACVLAAGRGLGMPATLAAVWAVAASVLLSGGLHEDGLADLADGFGGGRTVERKLEIMRDSRIGSYGVLALLLAVGIRIAALAALDRAGWALVAAGAVSRAAMGVPLLWLPPARPGGLGAAVAGAGGAAWAGFALAAVLAGAVMPGAVAVWMVVAGGVAAVAVGALARAQIGGLTGDVLGGCAVAAECAALSAAVCAQ